MMLVQFHIGTWCLRWWHSFSVGGSRACLPLLCLIHSFYCVLSGLKFPEYSLEIILVVPAFLPAFRASPLVFHCILWKARTGVRCPCRPVPLYLLLTAASENIATEVHFCRCLLSLCRRYFVFSALLFLLRCVPCRTCCDCLFSPLPYLRVTATSLQSNDVGSNQPDLLKYITKCNPMKFINPLYWRDILSLIRQV